MRWILLIVAVALVGLGAYWGLDLAGTDGEPVRPLTFDQEEPSAADPVLEPLVGDARPAEREPIEAGEAVVEAPQTPNHPEPTSGSTPETGFDLRCVDAIGGPIAGIRLGRSEGPSDPVESDELGRVAWRAKRPLEGRHTFLAEGRGRARRWFEVELEPGLVRDLGDLVLRRGGAIAGRVENEEGDWMPAVAVHGLPADDFDEDESEARLEGPMARFRPHAETSTDETGRYEIDGLAPGWWRLWARGPEANRWTFTEPVEVRPDETRSGVVLVLEPLADEDRIEGIVVNPDGSPHPRSRVHYRYRAGGRTGSGSIGTDEEGRFRRLTPFRGLYQLHASDEAGELADSGIVEAEPGDHDVELRLRMPLRVEVFAQDAARRPVEDYQVKLVAEDRSRDFAAHVEDLGSDVPGGRRFAAPALAFRVIVDAPGYEIAEQGPFPPDAPPTRLAFTLSRLPGIRGVVTAGGEPYAGALVEAFEVLGPGESMTVNGFLARSQPWAVVKDRSDREGRFDLGLRESGEYTLRATAEGFAPAEIGPLPLEAREGVDGLRLELTGGGSLRVRLVGAEGADTSRVVVGISRGDGYPVTRQPGPDGEILFEHLTPGPWLVRPTQEMLRAGSTTTSRTTTGDGTIQEIPSNCTVVEGRETLFELDLSEATMVRLEGRLTIEGRPPAGWRAVLEPEDGATARGARAAILPDGRFTLSVGAPGAYALRLSGRPAEGPEVEIVEKLELGAAVTTWALDVLTGRLEGRVTSLEAPGRARLSYYGRDDEDRRVEIRSAVVASDGRFALPRVPIGRGVLQLGPPEAPAVRRRVTIVAGSTATVDFE